MSEEKTRCLFTLSESDIEMVCEQKNLDCKGVDFNNVANDLKTWVEYSLENWTDGLESAILDNGGKIKK